jgi:hypothetical protein
MCGKPVKIVTSSVKSWMNPFVPTDESRSGSMFHTGKPYSFHMCDECHGDLVARARIKEEKLMVSGAMANFHIEGT